MKQRYLLLLALCCFAFTGRASTASGNVTYPGSIAAVGVKVYLYDSSFSPVSLKAIDSAVTSSTGSYSITATPATSGHIYFLQCNTCSIYSYYYLSTFSSSVTANIALSCSSLLVRDTLRNSTSGATVWAQKVYIQNAAATYKDSAYTNMLGAVAFNVPFGLASGTFTFSTIACGLQSQSFTMSGSAVVAPTMYVCVGNAIISGTLTNLSTSAPITNHKVNIVDSSATAVLWLDSAYTNASGFYSIRLPIGVSSGSMIAYAYTCGARIRNSAAYSGGSLTLNLSGCATSTATISGAVTNSGLAVAGQKVYLVDSVSLTNIYRDSTVTSATGGYSFTIPPSITSGFISLSTASCGGMGYNYYYYTGTSAVINFSVSTTSTALSGTAKYYGGAPAAGATVQLIHPAFTPISTTAAANGTYSFTIPCSWYNTTITIYMQSPNGNCNRYHSVSYTGSNIVGLVDSMCAYGVSGIVSKQGGGVAANAKVLWVYEFYDSSTTPPTITLTQYDSTVTNSAGAYSFAMDMIPYGNSYHRIKAFLQPSDPAYLSFLPTYHDSALVWSGGDTLHYTQWQTRATNIHVSLRGGVNPGGPGFISGNVLLGANKVAGVGDPLPGRVLLLTTAAGKAIAYTYSDGAGKFSFSSLPLGNYLLFGDAWGLKNPALAISLTQGKTSVSGVVFEENSVKFEGRLAAAGVAGTTPLGALAIYPNPVKDYMTVSGLSAIGGAKTAVLRNASGAIAGRYTIAAGAESIPAKGLPAGLYLLQLQTADGVASFRFIKE